MQRLSAIAVFSLCLLAGGAFADRARSRANSHDSSMFYTPANKPILASPRPGGAKPAFQFMPASGAGAGTECAGAVPTGAKGETVTFVRAGAATCTKSDGTVVKLTANQPVVETLTGRALSDGNTTLTGGQLGILDEAASTNTCLQSEALDNVAWSNDDNTGTPPTVTANAATAPDGTVTAERLQLVATGLTQFNGRFQAAACPVGTDTGSVYVKSHDGVTSGTVNLCIDGSSPQCLNLPYSGVWRRLVVANVTISPSTVALEIGNISNVTGQTRLAADLDVWGAQCEALGTPSSYIPTTTVAVTRSASAWTIATATLNGDGVTSAAGCAGGDAYFPASQNNSGNNGYYGCGYFGSDQASRMPFEVAGATTQMRAFDGTNQNSTAAIAPTAYAGTLQSAWIFWQTGVGLNSNSPLWGLGTPQATYANDMLGASIVGIGHTAAGCGPNAVAWLTRMRFDPDPTGSKCQ